MSAQVELMFFVVAFFGSWGTKDDIVLNHQKTPLLFPSRRTMMKVKGSPPGEIGGKNGKKGNISLF